MFVKFCSESLDLSLEGGNVVCAEYQEPLLLALVAQDGQDPILQATELLHSKPHLFEYSLPVLRLIVIVLGWLGRDQGSALGSALVHWQGTRHMTRDPLLSTKVIDLVLQGSQAIGHLTQEAQVGVTILELCVLQAVHYLPVPFHLLVVL